MITARLILFSVVVIAGVVLTQDLQIFPGLVRSLSSDSPAIPPIGIDPLTTAARDGTPVTVWRLRATGQTKRAALLFHGNGDNLTTFLPVQEWLAANGITSYSVEFRGFNGRGSGWPSESGLYDDAEAAFDLMLREEGITAAEALVLGRSIGTGIAAHVAATFQPKALILLSPYSQLTDLVSEMPVMGYLTPFLWYHFPTVDNIRKLKDTCVVAAHGKRDTIIPFMHSTRLREVYRGLGGFTLLDSEEAGHNDLLVHIRSRIPPTLAACGAL
jgi:alpha-beta hydrolase superfamily lysophospholipase